MAQYEWIILELMVLGLLVWELVRTRRSIARDRQAEKEKAGRNEA